jgi:hypothetical protein
VLPKGCQQHINNSPVLSRVAAEDLSFPLVLPLLLLLPHLHQRLQLLCRPSVCQQPIWRVFRRVFPLPVPTLLATL